MAAPPLSYDEISPAVERAVQAQRALDIHTHLFSPEFGAHMLWGIDELLNYHYLIAETLRQSDIGVDAFWKMNRAQQADHIWQTLFIENSPVSEACRGVITALKTLGADPAETGPEPHTRVLCRHNRGRNDRPRLQSGEHRRRRHDETIRSTKKRRASGSKGVRRTSGFCPRSALTRFSTTTKSRRCRRCSRRDTMRTPRSPSSASARYASL